MHPPHKSNYNVLSKSLADRNEDITQPSSHDKFSTINIHFVSFRIVSFHSIRFHSVRSLCVDSMALPKYCENSIDKMNLARLLLQMVLAHVYVCVFVCPLVCYEINQFSRKLVSSFSHGILENPLKIDSTLAHNAPRFVCAIFYQEKKMPFMLPLHQINKGQTHAHTHTL